MQNDAIGGFRIQTDIENIDWNEVVNILRETGMGFHTAETHRRAFTNSHTTVFVFDGDSLVGFGRALSDGEYQTAVYDVAVKPQYQGKGVGKMIMQAIMERTPGCNFILYASPGKESFYEKLGFRRMTTGMALFVNATIMQDKGFTE